MNQKPSETRNSVGESPKSLPEWAQMQEILLDGFGAGIFLCDVKPGFSILKISPYFTTITGYTSEQAVGENLNFLYGSKTNPAVTKAIKRALGLRQRYQGELLCYRADGKTVWCELTLMPVTGEAGLPGYSVGTLVDISERKKREELLREQESKYRGIFENSIQGVYRSSPEGRYLQVNKSLARMYGYRTTEALMEQVCDIENQIYVDPSMRDRFKKLIEEADQVRGLEYQVRRKDGVIIWISENARVVRDSNGKACYYEGFIEDISQRKQAEAALQESQQRLIETSRHVALAEITTGIIHNIGNALNSVNVSTGVVSEKISNLKVGNLVKVVKMLRDHEADLANYLTNDPKGQKIIGYLGELAPHLVQEQAGVQAELKSLRKSVEHASDIVARQQNYAKNAGRVESVQAEELVEDALQMNANSLARHQIEVVREYAPNLPKVSVQKHLILQILVNLIRNAQKAFEASSSQKKTLTMRVSREGGRVQIEVRDTGVGIPPENLSRIFTHGFTTRQDGHGFGLHSGLRMAKEMGCSLTASSEGVGKGASFVLEFPSQ